tara:strand:+ start:323 stop:511 length:189 start_codon:yes stop_codon:yes gene_type:complete
MWLAIVLACGTPYAHSCIVYAKNDVLFATEEACKEEAYMGVDKMEAQGFYARPACFEIGTNL